MKELTYDEVGQELGVHPYHVRRIAKRYPKILKPIVHGYNNIRFSFDQVKQVKVARQRDAVRSRDHASRSLRRHRKENGR
jgi:hypothetical protein